MESAEKTKLTVNTLVDAPVEKAWNYFTTPMHILHWYAASDEWHTSKAENDLQVGGRFMFRMEARDGSFGFDYSGEYIKVVPQEELQFKLDDDRLVKVTFTATENGTKVLEDFEAENTFSADMQLTGWQAILDNFKKHVETFKLQQLHAQIMINAPVEKVYQTMLDEQQYQDWTVAFNASSHFIGTWEKGSKMIFLGIDDQGNKIGVVSRIK
ncbi:MAG TPA: SRPBCC domain-containing protein, partial [Flavisolibacter sp.]|nr:SRPBCC domain-containing protein [Flavisolibacter sp.]